MAVAEDRVEEEETDRVCAAASWSSFSSTARAVSLAEEGVCLVGRDCTRRS